MLLRPLFLALSSQSTVRDIAVRSSLGRLMASRFVAGESLEDAIAAIRGVNALGMLASLDYLGENVEDEAAARAVRDEYLRLLDGIAEHGVRSNVSVKVTALGLDLGVELCLDNLEELCARASAGGNFIRLDMEGSDYTDATLEIYERLRERGIENVGVVLQSYLHRTEADARRLMDRWDGLSVRLCKGAYQEPREIAWQGMPEIRKSFIKTGELLSGDEAKARGVRLGIATHDPRLIRWGRGRYAERSIAGNTIEFQMLFGIRRDIQDGLAKDGIPLRIYIPYGDAWYPYFMRRLAERNENVMFVLRSLVDELQGGSTRVGRRGGRSGRQGAVGR